MTAVINFQLNPLANSFIPGNFKFSANKKTTHYPIENEAMTAWKENGKRNSDCKSAMAIWKDGKRNSDWKFAMTTWKENGKRDFNCKSEYKGTEKMNIQKYQNAFPKRIFFGSITPLLNFFLKNYILGQIANHMYGDSQLPMLQECLTDDDQKLEEESKEAEIKITPKTYAEEDECTCPPMFGWIVPPDFIGNPFNFKYECTKKYPHSPNCAVKQSEDTLDPKISQWSLDQCFSEMKDILADVYETISEDYDPITKWDEKYKIQDYLEVSDSEIDDVEGNESKGFGTEFSSRTANEPDLVDDGVHPLLQILPTSEDPFEKISKSTTFRPCNPPCSDWCEYFPLSAKDSSKKHGQKYGSANILNDGHQKSVIGCRPVFKRSLSADDASMYGTFSQSLNDFSETESREMLLLRRKDPLSYYRKQSSKTLTKGKKHGSCGSTDHKSASSIKSNMWGKFDGADSLWKPLPECIDASNQKQNFKKGRETKWLRTS